MSVRNWLVGRNLEDQAVILAEMDVFSMSDLGVRIFWEDTEKEATPPFVPEKVRAAFKETVDSAHWSDQLMEVLLFCRSVWVWADRYPFILDFFVQLFVLRWDFFDFFRLTKKF